MGVGTAYCDHCIANTVCCTYVNSLYAYVYTYVHVCMCAYVLVFQTDKLLMLLYCSVCTVHTRTCGDECTVVCFPFLCVCVCAGKEEGERKRLPSDRGGMKGRMSG